MKKASICIMGPKRGEYENSPDETRPFVPPQIFDAVQRVIKNKGCELLRIDGGMYVIQYSETGPFRDKISNEWLPVYVARIEEWRSGGIKVEEMKEFEKEKPT